LLGLKGGQPMFRYFFISALAMAGGYLWGFADGMAF
jgi:hypothetical protein